MDYGKTMTQQNLKSSVDINEIVEKIRNGNSSIVENNKAPLYADVSTVKDYQEALNIVINSERLFNELPSRIRERFKNDPSRMLEFINDPENLDEAVKLGMVKREEIKEISETNTKVQPNKNKGSKKIPKEGSKELEDLEDVPLPYK